MRVGTNGSDINITDYHFVMKLPNGRWVHKPSTNSSEILCPPFLTPEDVYWKSYMNLQTGEVIERYDSETIYLAISE